MNARKSFPSNKILPWVGSQKRSSSCAQVVLPAPEGPTRATVCPGSMRNETSCSTGDSCGPYVKLVLSKITDGGRSGVVGSETIPAPSVTGIGSSLMAKIRRAEARVSMSSLNVRVISLTGPKAAIAKTVASGRTARVISP